MTDEDPVTVILELRDENTRLRTEVERLQAYAAESDTALERLQATVTKFKQFDLRWEDSPVGCVGFRASVKGVLATATPTSPETE